VAPIIAKKTRGVNLRNGNAIEGKIRQKALICLPDRDPDVKYWGLKTRIRKLKQDGEPV